MRPKVYTDQLERLGDRIKVSVTYRQAAGYAFIMYRIFRLFLKARDEGRRGFDCLSVDEKWVGVSLSV